MKNRHSWITNNTHENRGIPIAVKMILGVPMTLFSYALLAIFVEGMIGDSLVVYEAVATVAVVLGAGVTYMFVRKNMPTWRALLLSVIIPASVMLLHFAGMVMLSV